MRRLLLFFYFLFYSFQIFSQKTGFYSEGLAPQKLNGKYGFVDSKGREEISYQYDTVYKGFHEGYAVAGKNGKAGLIDKKGKTIVPFEFSAIGEYKHHLIPVENEKGWGFYTFDGDQLID